MDIHIETMINASADGTVPTPETRIGHAVFVKSITAEREWLAELERRVDAALADRPMLLVMGLKDKPLLRRSSRRSGLRSSHTRRGSQFCANP